MSTHGGDTPSRKAHELAEHLKQAIADYRMRDAKVSDSDVQMAVSLLRPSSPQQTRVALAVIAGILGAFGAVALGVSTSQGHVNATTAAVYIGLALATAGTVVGVLIGRGSD